MYVAAAGRVPELSPPLLPPTPRPRAHGRQDAGIVQDIKHGVRLVAGANKNSAQGHNSPGRLTGDTGAFYCAAVVVRHSVQHGVQ